jgi:hypothetical protein
MDDRLKDFAIRLLDEEVASLREENRRLTDAIRRFAEQDATLSVQGGNVTVEMDLLTDAERDAVERAADTLSFLQADYGKTQTEQDAATLRGLLERIK